MKVRTGFVSNSSSSSFLIYGVCFESREEVFKFLGREDPEMQEYSEDDNCEDVDFYELAEKAGLEHHPMDGEYYYFGLSWDQVKKKETGGDFKKRVVDALRKVFKGATKAELKKLCDTHEQSYYC